VGKSGDEKFKRNVVGGRIIDYFNNKGGEGYIIKKGKAIYKLIIDAGELEKIEGEG
jgi:hypothetical protein